MKISRLIWIIIVFYSKICFGQTEITFRKIEQAVSYKSAWDLMIKNEGSNRRVVVVEISIEQLNSGKVYEARSDKFLLNPGQQLINYDNLPTIFTLFSLPGDNMLFKEGQYEVKAKLLGYPTLELLNEISYTFIKNKNGQVDTAINSEKKIQFHLNMNISGQYDKVFNDTFQFYPDYLRLQLSPQVTLFNIPVAADIFISTENTEKIFRGSDNVNIRFDYNSFKNMLLEKNYQRLQTILLEKLPGQADVIQKINKEYLLSNYQDASAILDKVDDSKWVEQIKAVEQLDGFKDVIKKSGYEKDIEKWRSWESKLSTNPTELAQQIKDIDLLALKQQMNSLGIDTMLSKCTDKIAQKKIIMAYVDSINKKSEWAKSIENPDKFKEQLLQLQGLNIGGQTINLNQLDTFKTQIANYKTEDLKKISSLDFQLKNMEKIAGVNVKDSLEKLEIGKRIKLNPRESKMVEQLKDVDYRNIEKYAKKMNLHQVMDTTKDIQSFSKRLYDSLSIGKEVPDEALLKLKSDLWKIGTQTSFKEVNKEEILRYKKIASKLDVDDLENLKQYNKRFIYANPKDMTTEIDKKLAEKYKLNSELINKYKNPDLDQLLRDPTSLKKLDEAFGLMSQKEKLLSGFKDIEIGNTFPTFSPLSINGVQVKGITAKFDNQKLYVGFAAGKLAPMADYFYADSIAQVQVDSFNKRTLVGLSLGLGSKQKSFIHLNYLVVPSKIYEKTEENEPVYSSSLPQVVSVEFGGQWLNNKYSASGEVAQSFIDNKTLDFKSTAFYGEIALKPDRQNKSDFFVKAQYLGSDFYSWGVPFMVKDRMNIELKADYRFFSDMLTLGVIYNEDIFNKSVETLRSDFKSIGINVLYNRVDWPYLQVNYSPVFSYRNIASEKEKSIFSSITLTAGYQKKWSKYISTNTQASYGNIYRREFNIENSSFETIGLFYSEYITMNVHQWNLRQSFKIKNNYDIQGNIQQVRPTGNSSSNIGRTTMLEMNGSFVGGKITKNTVGLLWGNSETEGNKYGFFGQTSVKITKFLVLDVRLQYNIFNRKDDNVNDTSVKGIMIRSMLNVKI